MFCNFLKKKGQFLVKNKYLYECLLLRKMTSPNDSVIICDTPVVSKRKLLETQLSNCRDRLRSCQELRKSLTDVYKSPLDHLRRNITSNDEAVASSNFSIVTTPSRKKRKLNTPKRKRNLDESVVVLNDTTPQRIVEISLSDSESNNDESSRPVKRRKKCKKTTPKLNSGLVKQLREKNNKKQATKDAERRKVNGNENADVNNSQTPCGSKDIEIVWVSKEKSSEKNQQTLKKGNCIILDTKPTLSNKKKLVSHGRKCKKLGIKKKNLKSEKKKSQPQKPIQIKKQNQLKKKNKKNTDSRPNSSVGTCGQKTADGGSKLREIIVDGSNVAFGHIPGNVFSEKALQLVIDYFEQRGHTVTAFLPQSMRTKNRQLVEELHKRGRIIFTPSRKIGSKRITPYDDRFILDYATKCNGIVITSDQYRDLWQEKPEWRDTIEKRLLAPTFVGDYLMFPEDPLGRTGPKLEQFLHH